MKLMLSFFIVFLSYNSFANEDLELKRLYNRLTGLKLNSYDQNFDSWLQIYNQQGRDTVIEEILKEPSFLTNRIHTLAAIFANTTDSPYDKMDDYQAILSIAMSQPDFDFRQVFSNSFVIKKQNLTEFSTRDVIQIDSFLAQNYDEGELADFLKSYTLHILKDEDKIGLSVEDGIYLDGLFSTQGFGKRYFSGGTNRRFVVATYDRYLCKSQSEWKDSTLDQKRNTSIGMDIDRGEVNGRFSEAFRTQCAACHATMDPQRSAAANYDYDLNLNRSIRYNTVVDKMNQNSQVYPDGRYVLDAFWENKLVTSDWFSVFGWRENTSGNGLKSYGNMIANSEQFERCITQRVVQNFCPGVDISGNQAQESIQTLANYFFENNASVLTLIKKVVTNDLCK